MDVSTSYIPLGGKTWILPMIAAAFTYYAVLVTYRLFLHPLTNVPGPKLAAITEWWEIYWNVWEKGRLPFELKKLHEIYGPIIRINPNGVHIADSGMYERIYRVGTPFTKDEYFYQVAFGPKTFFTVGDNAEHRQGREPVNQFFSRRSVVGPMQDIIQGEIGKLCQRLLQFAKEGKPFPLNRAFHCVTTDIITKVAWGLDDELILRDDFAAKLQDNLSSMVHGFWTRIYFPNFTKVMQLIPPSIATAMDETIGNFLAVIDQCRQQVIKIKNETRTKSYEKDAPPTVFHALLDEHTKVRGKKEESLETMTGIGILLYVAAVETTATALAKTTYHVLQDQSILKRLQNELDQAFPDPNKNITLAELESLPFLTAIIWEGLRVSYGVASRLPRIVPASGFEYKGHHLPPGVQVGMSAYNVHTDEAIFPAPFTYAPDRWLGQGKQKHLEKYLVSFSKGSRQCLGMNLAFAELYIAIGVLFRRFEMEVFETDDKDMEIVRDFFNAWSDLNARKLHVRVVAARG